MTTDLAGCNYNVPVGNEDMVFEQGVYRDEFLERMRLVFGNPDYISDASWGIVAETDPSTVTTSSTEPLVVTTSELTINVRAGIVVTKTGHRVVLPLGVTGKGVSSTDMDAQNVVTLKFFTTDPLEENTNLYGDPTFRTRVEPDEVDRVVVYTLAEWNALTAAQKNDHVALAIVTVQTDPATSDKILSVTHSNSSYSWLRPWFSPVDVKHRAQVGSGTVSETNPHGVSFNELTVGNFTLPMLTSHTGMVISQDKSVAGIPGEVCTISVPSGLLKIDASGTITGAAGSQYIDLGFYPQTLGAVYDGTGKLYPFRIRATSTIIFNPWYHVPASTDVTVLATKVTALMPPAGSTVTDFKAGSLGSYDAVVASGKIYVYSMSITTEDKTSSDAGPFPLKYGYYFANGKVVKSPQVLLCKTLLTSITGSGVTPTITQFGRGYALVGMVDAAAGSSLSVKVRVKGTAADGTAIEEVLTFGSTWAQTTLPNCSTYSAQFQRGTSMFKTITNVSLDESLNAGANAAIQLWVAMDPVTTPELSYAAMIADGQWDGTKLCQIIDQRTVEVDFKRSTLDSRDLSIADFSRYVLRYGEPGDWPLDTYFEDFRRPVYHSLGIGQGSNFGLVTLNPDDLRGSNRTKEGLHGIYESRALGFYEWPAKILVGFSPVLIGPDRKAALTSFQWSAMNGSGVWTSWASADSTAYGNTYVITSAPSDGVAFRVRVRGEGIIGMAILNWR